VQFFDFPALGVAGQHSRDVRVRDHWAIGQEPPMDGFRIPRNRFDFSRVNDIAGSEYRSPVNGSSISSTTLVVRTAIMARRPRRSNFGTWTLP
jgi:hypothetical protein